MPPQAVQIEFPEAEEVVEHPAERKIRRLRTGAAPRVLDLFSGCGGISLGFLRAGFSIQAALDIDVDAARTHGLNFHPDQGAYAVARDITAVDPPELHDSLGLPGEVSGSIDVLVGGPPCQAYARVGRPKLREIADHPRAFLQDPRRNLYLRYLEYVRQLLPLVVVMENVPDVVNQAGHNVAGETCEVLADLGYEANYTLLNAAYYGVPQMRERMFLVGWRRELGDRFAFPTPSHWVDLPRGYEGSRQVALKSINLNLSDQDPFYLAPPKADSSLQPAVTAAEALRDLPPISAHLSGELKRGARRFDTAVGYGDTPPSDYAIQMRTWPGFESRGDIKDHVIRSLPRDYPLFRVMHPGDQYPQAHEHALRLFQKRLHMLRAAGSPLGEGSADYVELYGQIVPPYDATKFPNKWRKMEPDNPARTLMAHLGKDGYSHIHYDSSQARTISVREAARLQSFPDGFIFTGTMNPAFRQIGNAVPPLLAHAIAVEIKKLLV